jgi:hypothetical protein
MIYVNQGQYNTPIATCSRNKQLSNPYYLWTIRHKLSNQSWQFIPYREQSITSYPPSYDIFQLDILLNQPEVYIGSNVITCNLHLLSGEFYVKIYEQTSSSNLNPSLSYDVVYEGMMVVLSEDPIEEIEYTGTTNTWVVYQG